MRTSEPVVQRECECGGTCDHCRHEDEEGTLQRASKDALPGAVPPVVHQVLQSRGEPLDPRTRAFMEPRLGAELGGVRVHRDTHAADSARAVQARAYTVGNHVVFGSGQYAPHSDAGRRLIGHELVHVLQQGAAPGSAVAPRAAAQGGAMLQRDDGPVGVHASPRSPSVPYEKYGEDVESAYRRAGLTTEADAVRNCRLWGNCSMLLTESEAYNAYRTGRVSAHLSDPGPAAVAGAVVAPRLIPGSTGGTAARTALGRAAARWGAAEVITGGAAAEAAGVTAVGVATVAVPVALGVYITMAIADLASYADFQRELHHLGYVILPAPLGVCIGLCHRPSAPTAPTFRPFPRLEDLGPRPRTTEDFIREWSRPVPVPAPRRREDEERARDCRLVRRTSPRGDDPLSELYCNVVSVGAPSYDIYSLVGVAEIDALRGRTWYECKCGQRPVVRAYRAGERWARLRFEGYPGLDEQIRRQHRIAEYCGYLYRLVVASGEVADFFRARYPDIDVVEFPWEPCE